MLDDVVYNKRITALRFRVKILRIHSFYSYVSGIESNWSYILVDEAVSVKSSSLKFLITCNNQTKNFAYAGNQDENDHLYRKCIQIQRPREPRRKVGGNLYVEIDHAYPGLKVTNFQFRLSATPYTKVHIIDPLNNHHYMKFKCINDIPHIMNKNYLIGKNANY